MLISLDQLKKSEKRFDDAIDSNVRGTLTNLREGSLPSEISTTFATGPVVDTNTNLIQRKVMLEEVKKEPVDFAFDRAIGKNDSVYSNFVELIRLAKQKVGRVVIKQGSRNLGYATGFMVAENLMLTNWHVFQTEDMVEDSEIQFFYEYDTQGHPVTPVCFPLRANVFFHSNKGLDYCLVGVGSSDTTGKFSLADVGYIYLDPTHGKIGSEGEEALNIIHHPEGDYMQLSIRENLFVKITPVSIWYYTDTAPGSSGSPVFNDQWQVVGLHHMGIGKKNDAGKYVDKNGLEIPLVNGKIDISKVVWEYNEGIRISVILEDVFAKFPGDPIINGLKIKPKVFVNLPVLNTLPPKVNQAKSESNHLDSNVHFSIPTSLFEKTGMVNISINQDQGISKKEGIEEKPVDKIVEEFDLAEIKRLEESTDFTLCKGYQSRFLGSKFSIPFPQPEKKIKKYIAKVDSTNSLLFKYYHYTTIFHSVRKMPVISGINIDGNPKLRLDTTPRRDVWLRDTRLDFDVQLEDKYYKGSGFDKGHMSRREDANWGSTPEEARRNADLTCMYTNACTQVPKINQISRKGLWGLLENIVLEKGAIAETGKTAKISVFSGPVFKDDDPFFRGVQVPMDFYKIVLWLTDAGALKATAFKLSQVALLSHIDFEQLNLDQNLQFKEYQCSIKSLQKETHIDFSRLTQYDTFEGVEGQEIALHSALEVLKHINHHNRD